MQNTKPKLIAAFALFTFLAAGVVNNSRVSAEDKEELLASGVFGITGEQTARLHAVPVGVAIPKHVDLMFFDRNGNLLAQSTERLLPGQAASLDFNPVGVENSRKEIYAVMRFVNGRPRRGYVIPTVEVIDDFSRKTIFMIADPEG